MTRLVPYFLVSLIGGHAFADSLVVTPAKSLGFEPQILTPPVPQISTTSPGATAPPGAPIDPFAPPPLLPGGMPAAGAAAGEKAKDDSAAKGSAAPDFSSLLGGAGGGGSAGGGSGGTSDGAGDGVTERDSEDYEGGYSPLAEMMGGYSEQSQNSPSEPDTSVDAFEPVINDGKKLDTSKWRTSRGLLQIPTRDGGETGPCGSYHYNPNPKKNGEVVDNYADPLTACTMMAMLQEWRRRHPSGAGSPLQWGDISHKTDPQFGGEHQSHTYGKCIDVRPPQNDESRHGTTINSADYNQSLSKELIKLMKSMGGSPVIFNDPATGGKSLAGHDNHIHVCFKDNERTQKTCDTFRIDPKLCGDL